MPVGREECVIETSQDVLLEDIAKHECEELKEGVWLEPIQAMLRRTTSDLWTVMHHNEMCKLVIEGRLVQKGMCDIGRPDEQKCPGMWKGRRYGET